MFFPKRIRGIRAGDRVLEIGPGGHPHPRADVLLERRFLDEKEAFHQRGHENGPPAHTALVLYDGGRFPFRDRSFDYVICSHVLEHVHNVDAFLAEVSRVAHRGYIEFPTVFYDYLYNFPEHEMLLYADPDRHFVRWMPKADSSLLQFKPIQAFFYESLLKGYDEVVWHFMPLFFQGFEFTSPLASMRVRSFEELLPTSPQTEYPSRDVSKMFRDWAKFNVKMVSKIVRRLVKKCCGK
ncbi:MAG TPA: class I SAM-dependent methyltransferase [Candidatus Ozemobacteraceae bacterium]|nr:class I SAM-dependent methyltransferase [Candidatus Ozemobacteraceae bacterium]